MAIQLLILDADLAVTGDPIDGWTELDCTTRFNEPASGWFTAPARPEVMTQLQPGHRLVVVRDGQVWTSGPLEIPQDYAWSIEGSPGVGEVTVNFSDDLALIAGYITWPTPASAWSAQPDNGSRTLLPMNSEEIIRTLVDENCGPGARAERRIPHLALDAVAGIGFTMGVKTRFEPLLDICRSVARRFVPIGFRTRLHQGEILFGCYELQDRTATARFSVGLGNLRAVRSKLSGPTITHALVQGGEVESPADRIFVQVVDAVPSPGWWRVEKLVDASEDTDADGLLTDAGHAALSDGAAQVELSTVTVDTADLRAGYDYGLGDRVTVELPTGLEVVETVQSIHLQATPESGEYVTTLIGSPEATSDPQMVRLLRELGRRLGRIEAR